MSTLTVGPGLQYVTIEAAVAASQPGDTIDVQAGTYADDFLSITHDLTLDAVGGVVVIPADEPPPNEKGIIDEGGAGVSVSISGFSLSGAAISDDAGGNGAGLRYEGGTLVLRDDVLSGNQDGLLANPDPAGTIDIEQSTFSDNGSGTGYTHNLYVGAIASLTVDGSTLEGAVVGHQLKSRAAGDTITDNVIADGTTGDASYEIDLPNGGAAIISGNYVQKGPDAQNPILISYGEEGVTYASNSLIVSGNTLVDEQSSASALGVRNAGTETASIAGNTVYGLTAADLASGPATASDNTFLTEPPPVPCFAAGTRLATPAGPVPVERLRVGDTVITREGPSAIVWRGMRHVACARDPHPERVRPVRIRAGAAAPGVPVRDLFLSPDHAVFLGGVLIPVRHLINGRSIAQVAARAVTYWHIELAQHGVVLAEGLPAESYLDTGNRAGLAGWGRGGSAATRCAALVEAGPALIAMKRRLFERAAPSGEPPLAWRAWAGRHRLAPHPIGNAWQIALQPGTRVLRLVSRPWMAAAYRAGSLDRRPIGIRLLGLALDGIPIPLNSPVFAAGFHAPEPTPEGWCRWTTGRAHLAIPAGIGVATLSIADHARPTL